MTNGFFLGGLAQGMETAERGLRADRELDRRDQEVQAELLQRADTTIKEHQALIAEMVQGTLDNGGTREQARKSVQPLIDRMLSLAGKVGRDPNVALAPVLAALQAPTAQEAAEAKGVATAQSRVAQRDALLAADVPKDQAETAAGLRSRLDPFTQALVEALTGRQGSSDAAPPAEFATDQELAAALADGRIQPGDPVVVNGVPGKAGQK